MKNKALLLVLLILSCFALLQAGYIKDKYDSMLDAYAKLGSWQSQITQTNYFAQTKTTLNSSGSFFYEKGKICIRYTRPAVQSLLVKDGKITLYDKQAKTAYSSALNSSVQSLNPVEIIKGFWKDSDLSTSVEHDSLVTFTMRPRTSSSIKEIKFDLNLRNYFIPRLTYTDAAGNKVDIIFSKIKLNPPIPASVWKLNLPKDTRIINR